MAIVLNGQTNDVTIDGVSVATESEAVLKTGNETIAGVKTFSSSPLLPVPTLANQAISMGNIIEKTGAGLGYGTGSGGTVTQLTSKSTAVTLNKPCGQITMHNESLAAGASVVFIINYNAFGQYDNVKLTIRGGVSSFINYSIDGFVQNNGQIVCVLKNITAGALAESVIINFSIIKGSIN